VAFSVVLAVCCRTALDRARSFHGRESAGGVAAVDGQRDADDEAGTRAA
jgi:hypothetical protein